MLEGNGIIYNISISVSNNYSIRLTFFVLFEKSNFLRKHHLLSCLPFKNIKISKTTLKKIYQKIELVN